MFEQKEISPTSIRLEFAMREVIDQFHKEQKELGLKKMAALLATFRDHVKFDKFVYHLFWDGDWESIHSYSSFGNMSDEFFTDTAIGDAWADHYKDFFNGQDIIVDEVDHENLNFSLECIAASINEIDTVIEFVWTEYGFFQAKSVNPNDYEPKITVEC